MSDIRAQFILGKDVIAEQRRNAIDVTTCMLDYKYVEHCSDVLTLKEILRILISGKEGRYPHLEDTVVEKILSLLPEKQRKKILSMTSTVSHQEAESEAKALDDWLKSIQVNSGHDDRTSSSTKSNVEDEIFLKTEDKEEDLSTIQHPPVRNKSMKKREDAPKKLRKANKANLETQKVEEKRERLSNTQRISKETHSNRDYFRAWDTFDYDAAEKSVDDEEDADIEQTKEVLNDGSPQEKWKSSVQKQASFDLKQLKDLQTELQVSKLSMTERKFMASREKDKGNEYFKNKEYQQSFNCYSKSLALSDQNAIVYANRAMACIRLSNLCQAVSDCTQALIIDPNYTKALARRGMVHHKCGRYFEAKVDFKSCVNQDPGNKEYHQLLKKSEEKHDEVNGIERHEKSKKKIVIIQEDDSDSDCDDDIVEIYTPGVLK